MMLAFRGFEFLALVRFSSRFVHMLRLVVGDILKWLTIFVFFWVAFAVNFHVLLCNQPTGNQFDDIFRSLITTFFISIGEVNLPFIDDVNGGILSGTNEGYIEAGAEILSFLMVFTVMICYLNILIAMMSTSYDKANAEADVQSYKSTAVALLRWETKLSCCSRKRFYYQVFSDDIITKNVSLELWRSNEINAWIRGGFMIISQKVHGNTEYLEKMASMSEDSFDRALEGSGMFGEQDADRSTGEHLGAIESQLAQLITQFNQVHYSRDSSFTFNDAGIRGETGSIDRKNSEVEESPEQERESDLTLRTA